MRRVLTGVRRSKFVPEFQREGGRRGRKLTCSQVLGHWYLNDWEEGWMDGVLRWDVIWIY